jgi:Flp pilus assembly pilin Flp
MRTIQFTVVPFHVVNAPPTSIFPSDCTAIELTVRLAAVPVLVVKTVSLVPSLFRRTIQFTVVPFHVVNAPPTSIFPSDCTAIELTVRLAAVPVLVVNVVSLVPSEFRRTI